MYYDYTQILNNIYSRLGSIETVLRTISATLTSLLTLLTNFIGGETLSGIVQQYMDQFNIFHFLLLFCTLSLVYKSFCNVSRSS